MSLSSPATAFTTTPAPLAAEAAAAVVGTADTPQLRTIGSEYARLSDDVGSHSEVVTRKRKILKDTKSEFIGSLSETVDKRHRTDDGRYFSLVYKEKGKPGLGIKDGSLLDMSLASFWENKTREQRKDVSSYNPAEFASEVLKFIRVCQDAAQKATNKEATIVEVDASGDPIEKEGSSRPKKRARVLARTLIAD